MLQEERNLLIYPTLDPKDGLDNEPFAALNEKFRNDLCGDTDLLLVIGYSFRDTPINKIFRSYLDKGHPMVVLSPTAHYDLYSCGKFENIPHPGLKNSQNPSFLVLSDMLDGSSGYPLERRGSKSRLRTWRKKMMGGTNTITAINHYFDYEYTQSVLKYIVYGDLSDS